MRNGGHVSRGQVGTANIGRLVAFYAVDLSSIANNRPDNRPEIRLAQACPVGAKIRAKDAI